MGTLSKKYLGAKYDEARLYNDLRCKLVHNSSEGGSYVFTDDKSLLHMRKSKDGGAAWKIARDIWNTNNPPFIRR